MPVLTWRLWGKASVPHKVNDRVAPQGNLGKKIHVRKNCRSLFLLFGKKRKKSSPSR